MAEEDGNGVSLETKAELEGTFSFEVEEETLVSVPHPARSKAVAKQNTYLEQVLFIFPFLRDFSPVN